MPPPPPFRTSPDESRWWLWGGTAVLGVVTVAGNVFLPSLARETAETGDFFYATLCITWVGVVLAQMGLAAIWLALGRPAAVIRVTFAVAAYLVLSCAILAGVWFREEQRDVMLRGEGISTDFIALLLVPSLVGIAGAPLWCMRLLFGWHIRHLDAPLAAYSRQYSIASLLTLTTLVALLIGSVQWAHSFHERASGEFWLMFGGCALAAFLLSLLTVLPAAVGLSRHYMLGFGVFGVFVLGGGFLWAMYGLWMLSGFGGSLRAEEIFRIIAVTICPVLSYFGSVALPLWGVHLCGYRLMMGKSDQSRG